jgi:hypothetical protein
MCLPSIACAAFLNWGGCCINAVFDPNNRHRECMVLCAAAAWCRACLCCCASSLL